MTFEMRRKMLQALVEMSELLAAAIQRTSLWPFAVTHEDVAALQLLLIHIRLSWLHVFLPAMPTQEVLAQEDLRLPGRVGAVGMAAEPYRLWVV